MPDLSRKSWASLDTDFSTTITSGRTFNDVIFLTLLRKYSSSCKMRTLYSHNDYNYAYPTFDDKYLFEQKKQDFNTISNIKDYLQLSVKVIQGYLKIKVRMFVLCHLKVLYHFWF